MTQEAASQFVMFVGGGADLNSAPVGAEQDYGKVGDFFERRAQDVVEEWDRISHQMMTLLERFTARIDTFDLEEVEFELGFSAAGHLGFIATSGAKASVRMIFRRKLPPVGPGTPGPDVPGT